MTYAQANKNEFPTCYVFSEKLLEFFCKNPKYNDPAIQRRGKHYRSLIQKLSQMVTN